MSLGGSKVHASPPQRFWVRLMLNTTTGGDRPYAEIRTCCASVALETDILFRAQTGHSSIRTIRPKSGRSP
jgi:hypothetical protein